MADPQEGPGMASSSSGDASSSSNNNAGNPGYWCYQCRKEVAVEAHDDGTSATICAECRNGFVEPLAPAFLGSLDMSSPSGGGSDSNSGYTVNGLRRRRRRGNGGGAVAATTVARVMPQNAQTVSLNNAFGQLYPQQLAHVLQVLGQAARANNENGGSSDESRHESEQQEQENSVQVSVPIGENSLSSPEGGGTHNDEEDESESEVEAGLLEHWESDDEEDEEDGEDEWEEVVDEDGDGAAEQGGEENNEDDRGAELVQRRNARGRREPRRHLRHYLQELLQNLVGQNIEVRVEVPQYVGNPGDYVDARGFELLLQQLAENDNSRRGAPPAAKSAVDKLPTILIEQAHIDDGSALCAVCKDILPLGDPAKQMPCLHLYHAECILPWLDARNSCPVCRFELPTDDPDYEDQKTQRRSREQRTPARAVQHVESQQQTEDVPPQETVPRPGSSTATMNAATSSSSSSSSSSRVAEEIQPDEGTGNEASGSGEQQRSLVPGSRSRSSGRGWFMVSPAPMLSMVGIVLVICLGNHLIGGGQRAGGGGASGSGSSSSHIQRQADYSSQETRLDQIAGSSDNLQARRRWWWLPFHPR